MLIVTMGIMNICTVRFSLAAAGCMLVTTASALFAGDIQTPSVVKVERPISLSAARAQATDVNRAIDLETGKTTIVMKLSSPQTMSALSFMNNGAKGAVTVFASSLNLPTNSMRWQPVATSSLVDGLVKSVVRPNEARYVKVTFDVMQPGQVSQFGVATASTVAKRAKDYALLAADSNAVESDGKSVVDGKDLGEAKDIPSEGEAPAEGPPPGLPDPPPFVFVPLLVPTSP